MRRRERTTYRWFHVALLAGLLTGVPAITAQAQRSHVGARIGYDFDRREAVLSADMSVPVSPRVDFYPSMAIYTPDRGSRVGFNGDFKVRFPARGGPDLYLGGGLGIETRNVGTVHNTDLGPNLLMGIESRSGWVHPFGEVRVQVHDQTSTHLIGGLHFTIGGP